MRDISDSSVSTSGKKRRATPSHFHAWSMARVPRVVSLTGKFPDPADAMAGTSLIGALCPNGPTRVVSSLDQLDIVGLSLFTVELLG